MPTTLLLLRPAARGSARSSASTAEMPEELEPVMVRRLKSDLRALGVPKIPQRHLVELRLEHGPDGWSVQRFVELHADAEPQPPHAAEQVPLAGGSDVELRLSELLADTYGEEDDAQLQDEVVAESRTLSESQRPARARELLEQMLDLADRHPGPLPAPR